MAITIAEWNIIQPNLTPGCTFFYGNVQGKINTKGLVDFTDSDYTSNWDIKYRGGEDWHRNKLSNFKFPDGTSMISLEMIKKQKEQKLTDKFKLIESRHLQPKKQQTKNYSIGEILANMDRLITQQINEFTGITR